MLLMGFNIKTRHFKMKFRKIFAKISKIKNNFNHLANLFPYFRLHNSYGWNGYLRIIRNKATNFDIFYTIGDCKILYYSNTVLYVLYE